MFGLSLLRFRPEEVPRSTHNVAFMGKVKDIILERYPDWYQDQSKLELVSVELGTAANTKRHAFCKHSRQIADPTAPQSQPKSKDRFHRANDSTRDAAVLALLPFTRGEARHAEWIQRMQAADEQNEAGAVFAKFYQSNREYFDLVI